MDGAEVARGRGVWALALGQTLAYAALFYIFAALVRPWQQALGWDKAAMAAGPTLALLIAAGLAPFAGRLVDRFGHTASRPMSRISRWARLRLMRKRFRTLRVPKNGSLMYRRSISRIRARFSGDSPSGS